MSKITEPQPNASSFIQSITLGQQQIIDDKGWRVSDRSETREIQIATPEECGGTALTIIAGRNRTGKTYLLRNAERAMRAHDENLQSKTYDKELGGASGAVRVTPASPSDRFASCLYLTNLSEVVRLLATLPIYPSQKDSSPLSLRKVIDARNQFLLDQLVEADSFKIGNGLALSKIDAQNSEKRRQYVASLDINKVYRANFAKFPLLAEFEKICGGKIYFHLSKDKKTFSPVLRFGPGELFSFGGQANGWSYGQKIAFLMSLVINYARPKIFLIDEIENHLHPEFISQIARLIKENVPQTVISTHHPHLIFSDVVDRAWFFEIIPTDEKAPLIENAPISHPLQLPAPKRRIIDLSTDFERIAAAYNLFDSQDKQMLNLALAAKSQASFQLLAALDSALTLKVLPQSKSRRPDAQSAALADVLLENLNNIDGQPQILDFGAGMGRTFFELSKERKIAAKHAHWTFYEPVPRTREKLENQLRIAFKDIPDALPKVTGDLVGQDSSYDIILVVNIIHECTPTDIYHIFAQCRRLLRPAGKLLIAEIHPLIEPERFGIGYTSADMTDVVHACGFTGTSRELAMRGGTLAAYTFIARPDNPVSTESAREAILENVWAPIKRRCLLDYKGSFETRNSGDALRLAANLHVVSSMEAYIGGHWRDLA